VHERVDAMAGTAIHAAIELAGTMADDAPPAPARPAPALIELVDRFVAFIAAAPATTGRGASSTCST
jgi:hypothetical protein